ncbi:MAG TPA: UMP kinase [Ruminococcaceae bacterium]|nr:UMP kinase [Oscillospiraceae bacterium]
MKPVYNRILLKLSGEVLAGEKGVGIDFDKVLEVCASVKECADMGVQVAIVVGGGNFWRGRSSGKMDRTRADHMGMLATSINALALADALEQLGVTARVQTAIEMRQIAEPYIRNKAVRHLEKGRVVIFGCGTGNPFFSTDTAATLRAVEIEADILLKATMVDGVYDKDPHKYEDAVRYSRLTFSDVLGSALQVMDSTAASMCRDNKMPMLVFDLSRPENIYDAVMGEDVGTVVSEVDPIAAKA